MPSESIAQQNPVTHITIPPGGVVRLPAKAQVKQCPQCSWCAADTDPLSAYPAIRLEQHIKDRHGAPPPTKPRPWIYDGGVRIGPASDYTERCVDLEDVVAILCGPGSFYRGHAELIVRAVNSHEPMLAALKVTLEYWKSTGFADCDEGCECIVDAVRAAIALAEGR